MFYIVEHEFIDLEADSDLWGVAWLMDQSLFNSLWFVVSSARFICPSVSFVGGIRTLEAFLEAMNNGHVNSRCVFIYT